MALKITKATDPIKVENLVVTVTGLPGLGKSTIAQTAESPLTLDTDGGIYRAKNRQDSVPVKEWSDIATLTAEDLKNHKTIAVDTVGRLIELLAADIYNRDPKNRNGANLSIKAYGTLKAEFTGWLSRLRSMGKDIVLLAHADEQKKGEEIIERLDVQGGSKNEIYKVSDVMGRLYVSSDKKTRLDFNPSDTGFGKNPAQLDVLMVPHYNENPRFLAEVIAKVKATLNEMTEEQREVAAILSAWNTKAVEAKGAEAFNTLISEVETVDERAKENVKRVIWAAATAQGLSFDKKQKAFKEPVAA
jgi:hypothetical protein